MRILTVNAGSSSIRLAAIDTESDPVRRLAEFHGESPSDPRAVLFGTWSGWNLPAPDAVSHRVVQGGPNLIRTTLLTEEVESEIERVSPLAPLHNPRALAWIRGSREVLGAGVPQVAVFDTAFYASLPDVASTYALPRALTGRHGIRRYGFHGLAHQAMWKRWRRRWPKGRQGQGLRAISFQLGAGCSVTAIRDGEAQDTSMGFSPTEGLVMATRSGDVDPGLLAFVQRLERMDPDGLERLLNEESGLLGVSGKSADMRELLEAADEPSRLAVRLYAYRARKYLGAYLAVLGGADAVLFGGGVGENAPAVRESIVSGFEWAGILLDPERNRRAVGRECRIDSHSGPTEIRVIPVDEASTLAEEAASVLAGQAAPASGRTPT